jgi:hypothetical protein
MRENYYEANGSNELRLIIEASKEKMKRIDRPFFTHLAVALAVAFSVPVLAADPAPSDKPRPCRS